MKRSENIGIHSAAQKSHGREESTQKRLYDAATWMMYHRITSARRRRAMVAPQLPLSQDYLQQVTYPYPPSSFVHHPPPPVIIQSTNNGSDDENNLQVPQESPDNYRSNQDKQYDGEVFVLDL